jgi:ribosome biogenesis GTPase
VVTVHRGELDVATADGTARLRVPGRFAHEGTDVAVGDWIAVADGAVDSVLPRRSAIVRNAAGRATRVQTLVANVDVAFVVTSLGPELEARRIERYLVTIWDSGASPEIVLTKADRVDDRSGYVAEVEAAAPAVPVHVVSARTGEGVDELRARIASGVTAVLLGSSGVGKSTLVNRFAGSELMATRETRADDDEGRHTTRTAS